LPFVLSTPLGRCITASLAAGLSFVLAAGCSNLPRVPPSPTAPTTGTTAPTTGTTFPGSARALVFAEFRTNYTPWVRVRVADGPLEGTVAEFEPSSGMYEIRDLPSGVVTLEVSAAGFTSITATVPVGATDPTALVLQRTVPLADATHLLGGSMYLYPSQPGDRVSATYPGVKVEILQGPLAGIFTFSDDALGAYDFGGLPPGPLQVRASADSLEPQTLETVVSGRFTLLDFVMKKR
jgi:hypothetical protein